MNTIQWNKEYEELETLFKKLEAGGFHARAEQVADRLSEMELMTVEPVTCASCAGVPCEGSTACGNCTKESGSCQS